ncbi:hypothetical protein HJFPF1_06143 [Paramyrothecium foliicola]|nr:hypothetical protein HJFPF1_06143 [Paramyrothecium foliicola]
MAVEIGASGRVVPMRVIVCGVHRTGTLSMQSALWQLGFYDCYHMHTLLDNTVRDAPQWVRAIEAKYAGKGSFDKRDWDNLLGRCQAVCDIPAAFFGAELAELYPDAKVIILNRDPEKWYQSVLGSIWAMVDNKSPAVLAQRIYCAVFDDATRSMLGYVKALRGLAMPYDHGKDKDEAIAWYESQYKEFRDRIPAERRIEYSVGDGWKPLCEFLDVPIPLVHDEQTGEAVEAPFPRLNDRQNFFEHTGKRWTKSTERATDSLLRLVGKATVAGALGFGLYLTWKTRLAGRG